MVIRAVAQRNQGSRATVIRMSDESIILPAPAGLTVKFPDGDMFPIIAIGFDSEFTRDSTSFPDVFYMDTMGTVSKLEFGSAKVCMPDRWMTAVELEHSPPPTVAYE